MSVYLTPVTFENAHPTPSDDAAAWAACVSDGISSGCAMSKSGSTLSLAAGKLVIKGRIARVDTAQAFSVSGTSGYARLVITIDLSKTLAQQVALDIQTASSESGFSSLTQDDINEGGTKYQQVLCLMSLGSSGISSILWKIGKAHANAYGVDVTLTPSGWNSSNEKTVRVTGVLPESEIICTYKYSEKAAFVAADVDAVSYGLGWVKFHVANVPGANVTARLLIL